MPFYIDLQIRDYYTCRELITEAVEKFNAALDAQRAHNTACPMFYTLDPSADKLEHNYFLYRAKKKGTAKDDPSMSLNANVSASNCDRFSLSVNSTCFLPYAAERESRAE